MTRAGCKHVNMAWPGRFCRARGIWPRCGLRRCSDSLKCGRRWAPSPFHSSFKLSANAPGPRRAAEPCSRRQPTEAPLPPRLETHLEGQSPRRFDCGSRALASCLLLIRFLERKRPSSTYHNHVFDMRKNGFDVDLCSHIVGVFTLVPPSGNRGLGGVGLRDRPLAASNQS